MRQEARKNMYEMERKRLLQLISMLQSSIDDLNLIKTDCTAESGDRLYNVEIALKAAKREAVVKVRMLELSIDRLKNQSKWQQCNFDFIKSNSINLKA